MTEDLFVPKLGQTVEEVVLINWLVQDGDKVEFGDPVLEVETDKAIFNVEANAKGYIHYGDHEIGEAVPVLTVVATIGKKDEGFSPSSATVAEEEGPLDQPVIIETKPPDIEIHESPAEVEGRKIFASPRARKLANEKGVDLSSIRPTGGKGVRIVEDDVLAFIEHAPNATPVAAAFAREMNFDISGLRGSGPKGAVTRADVEGAIQQKLAGSFNAGNVGTIDLKYPPANVIEKKPLSGVRKIIFDRMAASDQLTARVTLVTEVDATELVKFREKLKVEKEEIWGFKPGYNDLLGVIVAQTLGEFQYMNARLSKDGSHIEYLENINLGFAVDTDRGLMVPVVKDADKLELKDFGIRFRSLVDAARSGRISLEDLSGGTFTITNLGAYDVDAFTPVINLPELAILGVGRIQDKVVPVEGEIIIRKMMTLSLVFDHRLVDGAPAAAFLQRLKEGIENPVMIFV
jgi:pyruvate dehydrogenase E2 component (dihydrolipoamide acetyltransferase)